MKIAQPKKHISLEEPRVALVYDRVNKWGGAERVLLALHEIYPQAPLYTSVCDLKRAPWAKVFPKIITSFLQKIPLARTNHEFLAAVMPFVFESFNFSDFDLVISVTSEAAKGIKTSGNTMHICYCLTPTRYLWSGYDTYFGRSLFSKITWPVVSVLRKWDIKAAQRPDVIIGISGEVRKRIKKYYKRDSKIIFPPVENLTTEFTKSGGKYFLVVGRLVGYKKVDLAIRVFTKLGLPLVIVGEGRQKRKLQKIAGKNIKFVGKVGEKVLIKHYLEAKALIMPQEEDFGIVAVEAQSLGIPVIAYKKGGASDTVIHNLTGILFNNQTVKSLEKAVLDFQKIKFDRKKIINNAFRFSKKRFKKEFLDLTKKMLN